MDDSIETQSVSPRDFGRAVGVSESTVKRWVDQGRLVSTRTAGGHRRISSVEALRTIREMQLPLQDPVILGVSDVFGDYAQPLALPGEALYAFIAAGESKLAYQVVFGEYMRGSSVWEIADQVIRPAMHRIGLGGHDPEAVLIEHRATQIVLEIARALQKLATGERAALQVVIGGASKDPYQIPCALIAGVIAEAGAHPVNLGPNTPASVFLRSLESSEKPVLLAISVSVVNDVTALSLEMNEVLHAASEQDCVVAIGGRAVGDLSLDSLPCLRIHTSMACLAQEVRMLTSP
jgi:excisionase family DNA binding protein